MASGNIVRSAVSEVPRTGRNTQGVTFARPGDHDRIIAVARNLDTDLDDEDAQEPVAVEDESESVETVNTESQSEDVVGSDPQNEEA